MSNPNTVNDWFSLLSVPGNIRQQYIPFVLKPSKDEESITKRITYSQKGLKPQFFSFKYSPTKTEKGDKKKGTMSKSVPSDDWEGGFLSICPSSFMSLDFKRLFKKDVSFKSVYPWCDGRHFKVFDLFSYMPSVRVREYTPDLRIDQMINMFSGMYDVFKAIGLDGLSAFKTSFGKQDKNVEGEKFWQKVWSWMEKNAVAVAKAAKDAAGTGFNQFAEFSKKLIQGFAEQSFIDDNSPLPKNNNVYDKDWQRAVINFPFTMYYKLQSSLTTNIYDLPCRIDNAFDIDGQRGWSGGRWGPSDSRLMKILEKLPGGIGDFVGGMFGNIRINYAVNWNAKEGSDGPYPSITVKFCLFNDNLESAVINYIFVNTIAVNCMWVQDGFLQHSGSVYDVRIDGGPRLFMCKGHVKVNNKGVYRNPPNAFYQRLINKHLNPNVEKKNALEILNYNNLRIPDVYEVEIVFNSVFPMNLNDYLFKFAYNSSMSEAFNEAYSEQYMQTMGSSLSEATKNNTTQSK